MPLFVMALALALGMTAGRNRSEEPQGPRSIEEAAEALASGHAPFAATAALADRLRAALDRAGGTERRGRLALLWLQTLRRALRAIPMDGLRTSPYREWLASHEDVAVYNEPGGQWQIHPEVPWKVHTDHRSSRSAEAIAWLAVDNGLPGECEGYVPCYAHGMNRLDGEYLRQHPAGEHAPEAVERIRASLAESLRLLAMPDHLPFLNPATDCTDLTGPLAALRAAVAASPHGAGSEAILLADRLLAFCPARE